MDGIGVSEEVHALRNELAGCQMKLKLAEEAMTELLDVIGAPDTCGTCGKRILWVRRRSGGAAVPHDGDGARHICSGKKR